MKFLVRLGVNRGLMGGNRFFATLGVVAGFIRLLQKLAGTGPKTVYKSKLKKGQTIVITDRDLSR